MTLHFQDDVATNLLTIDATDPKSGTAEFKATAICIERLGGLSRWTSRSSARADQRARAVDACSAADRMGGGGAMDARRAPPGRPRGALAARPAAAALHAVRRIGWVSRGALNYICRRLTCRPPRRGAWPPSTTSSPRRPRPPVVAHVCDDIACRITGRRGSVRGARARAGPPERRATAPGRPGCGARVWANASARPPALVTAAGEAPRAVTLAPVDAPRASSTCRATARRPPRLRRGTRRLAAPRTRSVPQAGSPDSGCSAASARVDPRSLDAYRAQRRLPRAARARSSWGQAAMIAEVTASKLRGPRRRGVPDRAQVGRGRDGAGPAALPRLQRRRVRAGHVQGPRADGGGPVRGRRGR